MPFGNLRITGYVLLPAAYRSLSRPSSPVRAKASAIRPYLHRPAAVITDFADAGTGVLLTLLRLSFEAVPLRLGLLRCFVNSFLLVVIAVYNMS